MLTFKKWARQATLAGLAALSLLAGCKQEQQTSTPAAPKAADTQTFRILAGSELKDVAQEVQAFAQTQGVKVSFEYSGSLDAVDRLQQSHSFDAVWLSHGKYPRLVPAVAKQIKASEKTMYSRVVLGVKPEKLSELGWSTKDGQVSWKDVLASAKSGKLKLAMTNPAGSNTGFVTLVGLAAELSGKGDALEVSDIPGDKLRELFSAIRLTSGSSGDLADKFRTEAGKADVMVNYESTIRSMAATGTPLTVLTPKEGVITADYPLMLLANSGAQAFYEKLVAHLREPATQERIAKATFRTPLTGGDANDVVNELPFPGSLKVVDALLDGYLNQFSRPSTSYFVLDVSGSMSGDRMNSLKQAMGNLASGDGSVSGRFSTFRDRERVMVTPFNDTVLPTREFKMTQDRQSNQAVLGEVKSYVQGLRADGGTGIYSALKAVYANAQADLKKETGPVSIVLMTDGINRDGISLTEFLAYAKNQGSPAVPVYAIVYGEASNEELSQLAQATGGKTFDARQVSLSSVMKAIRNYQ